MSFVVRTYSLGDAHEKIIKRIIQYGTYVVTEDEEKTIELPEPAQIHVDYPFTPRMISPFNQFGEAAMGGYVDQLLKGAKGDFAYTYHERLFAYNEDYEEGDYVNQVDYVVEKLKGESNSRRAQAITWQPGKDNGSGHPPCLQRMQCFVRDDKLNMVVDFRSNDMLSALGANMYALVHLQKQIADSLGVPVGWYEHNSSSAHIYVERDWDDLLRYVDGLGIQGVVKIMLQKYYPQLGHLKLK